MSMLSTVLRSATAHRNFRKTSNLTYSVWKSVKDQPCILINFQCGPHVQVSRVHARLLSSSSLRPKEPSSKIEETVERLKEKVEEDIIIGTQISKSADEIAKEKSKKTLESGSISSSSPGSSPVAKKSLWVRIKNEVKHYYSGFRLLFLDVKVSSKIVWKITRGKTLTRRESRQLVRTTSDLFRLVPFSVFIIVPFMELLLPVALKLFPGMLPSTFTTTSQREDKLKKAVVAKLEYTRFLQKTLDEIGPRGSGRSSKSARDFVAFYQEVKQGASHLDNDKIMKFAKIFEDDITLDNMDRNQLSAICRLLNLTPIGTSNFLRLQIELRLRHLKADDRLIQREGMDRLSHMELQNANQERGMPAFGLSEGRLKAQLGEWIALSLNYKVPPSLLLLSRTLYNVDNLAPTQKIASAISALPEKAASATSATIGEREGKIRNVVRLEQIREEERKIQEEANEQAKLEKIKLQQSSFLQKKTEVQVSEPVAIVESTSSVKKATVTEVGDLTEEKPMVDTAPVLVDKAPELGHPVAEVLEEAVSQRSKQVSESQSSAMGSSSEAVNTESLGDLKSALQSLGMSQTEVETVEEIKKELEDYDEDRRELDEIKNLVARLDLHESRAAKLLFWRVNKMLKRADKVVANLVKKEQELREELDEPETELLADKEICKEKLVTIQELIEAVTKLQETPNQARVDQIAEVLAMVDADADGVVQVDHVFKVIELLGAESTELPAKQLKQIINVLSEEEKLKLEDSIEDILVKKPAANSASAKAAASKDEAFEKDLKALEDLVSEEGKKKSPGAAAVDELGGKEAKATKRNGEHS